jgi:hypothetical protein
VLITGTSSTPRTTPPEDTKQVAPSEKQPEARPADKDKTTKPKPPPPDPG